MLVLGVILRNPSFTEEIIIKEQCVPLVIMKETVVLHYSLHLYPVLHNCKCDLVISDKGSNTELCISVLSIKLKKKCWYCQALKSYNSKLR